MLKSTVNSKQEILDSTDESKIVISSLGVKLNHTKNLTREEYLMEEVLCRASIPNLEIIGEATKKLSNFISHKCIS